MMNRRRHRGFTLVEMITAVAIIAVIAASLYGSVRIALTARQRSEANIAVGRMLRHTIDRMCVDLLGATPADGVLQREFVGEADWLRFCCNTARDGADVQLVEYAAVEDGDGVNIVRRVTRNLLAQVEALPDERVIAANVQSMLLRYYDGYDWLDQWDAATADGRLPLAVEITVISDRDQLITTVRPAVAQLPAGDTQTIR
jgi:general secretion pathway protein J